MNTLKNYIAALFALVLLACGNTDRTPDPIAVEEVPSALRMAFEGAEPNLKKQVEQVGKEIAAKNFPGASIQLSALSGSPALSQDQRSVVNQAITAVNEVLQQILETAANQGGSADPAGSSVQAPAVQEQDAAAAAAVMRHYQQTK